MPWSSSAEGGMPLRDLLTMAQKVRPINFAMGRSSFHCSPSC